MEGALDDVYTRLTLPKQEARRVVVPQTPQHLCRPSPCLSNTPP